MRALLGSLLLGLAVRGWFTRVRVLPDGQEVFEEIPAEDAVIPNVADRNMRSQPSAAVEDVLASYPGLHDRLKAVPRYEHDSNTVDDVGTKLETNFANSLTVLFLRRLEQGVALAGARVIAGSHEHQRRFGLPVDGSPSWTEPGAARAHHIKLDTQALFGLMRIAGMLPADITSDEKFRSGVDGPKDSEVANRWNAFLPNLAAVRPNVGQ
ncbi:hypothetical protein HaLaN_30300, partial [Haematococcus lacustris]